MRCLIALFLLCWCWPAALLAQNVSDLVIDGLPSGMVSDDLVATLVEKKGTLFAKAQEPGDRQIITTALQDAGYLDAEVKSAASFIPGGVKLVFTVTPHNLYKIEAVKVTGLSKTAVQTILDAVKVTSDSICSREVCQRLSDAIAEKIGMNVLFLGMEHKSNANKHDTTLIFSH